MVFAQDFFDWQEWDHQAIFAKEEAVWTALDRLPDYLAAFFTKKYPTPVAGLEPPLKKY